MNEWWNDSNLRTARSLREAGIDGELTMQEREVHALHFLAGFATGVLGTLFLILMKVMP